LPSLASLYEQATSGRRGGIRQHQNGNGVGVGISERA